MVLASNCWAQGIFLPQPSKYRCCSVDRPFKSIKETVNPVRHIKLRSKLFVVKYSNSARQPVKSYPNGAWVSSFQKELTGRCVWLALLHGLS